MKFGGHKEADLSHLERTAETNENQDTVAHAIPNPGMRFGGRDETREHQIVTRIDHLEGRLVEHVRENLAPRISEHSRISQKTDRVPFIYYQKLAFGRLCSCWTNAEAGADKGCPVCYGETFVSGFRKYGCEWHTVDATYPAMTLVNVAPDYDSGKRPLPLKLLESATRGYVEMSIQLQPNRGIIDAMRLGAFQPSGSKVTMSVRTTAENVFTVVTGKAMVEDRLRDADGNPNTLVFRFDMRRTGPDAPMPTLTYMHLRYRVLDTITIMADIAQTNESIELQEHGLVNVHDTIDFAIDRTLPNVQTGDIFIRVDSNPLRDNQRYKATAVQRWDPWSVLMESIVRARFVSRDERWYKVLGPLIGFLPCIYMAHNIGLS